MKFRIVKDGNNNYRVQVKNHFFDGYHTYSRSFNEIEEAEEAMMNEVEFYKNIKLKKQNAKKFTVIRTEKV